MKWSWKLFGIQLVAAFAVAFVVAYFVSITVDAKSGPDASDSTTFSMAIGGMVSAVLLAVICGWRRLSLKVLLVVGPVISGLYSGSAGLAVMTIPLVAVLYFSVSKVRDLFSYYSAPSGGASTEEESF